MRIRSLVSITSLILVQALMGCEFKITVTTNKQHSTPSVDADTTPPTVTITRTSGQNVTTDTTPISFDVTFSEPVEESSVSATSLQNSGTANITGATLTSLGDGSHFRFVITSATDGTIDLNLPTGAATDLAGNLLEARTQTDAKANHGYFVQPLYARYGAKWNDYVKNDGTAFHSGTGAACVGTEPKYTDCLHAGELRKVMLPGDPSSCTGYSITDSLGLFEWTCISGGGEAARFVSRRLRPGKGLKDLLNGAGTAWLQPTVTVTKPDTSTATSAASAWWSNTVSALPANGGGADQAITLSTPSRIYTLATDSNSQGYHISADKVAIVTLNGSKLVYGGSATNNVNNANGTSTAPTKIALIAADNVKHIWLEGKFVEEGVGTSNDYSLFLYNIRHSRLQDLWMYKGGPSIQNSAAIRVHGMRHSVWGEPTLANVTGSFFQDLNFFGVQFSISQTRDCVFDRVTSSSPPAGNFGINMWESGSDITDGIQNARNTFSKVLITNAAQGAIQLTGDDNVLVASTFAAINNSVIGFWSASPTGRNVVHNTAIVDGGWAGIAIGQDNIFLSQVAATGNGVSIWADTAARPITYKNNLLVDGGCTLNSNPVMNDSCVGAGFSTVTIASARSSFTGKVTTDEVVNTSDTTGSSAWYAYAHAFDSFGFVNPFSTFQWFRMKTWGQDGVSFSSKGTWTSGTGNIWDYTLKAADTLLKNTTVDGTTQNAALTNGAACPAFLDGTATTTDLRGRTFLTHAIEILDDDLGNDNGLCEAGEACLYTPNFGAYQGHGDESTRSCVFASSGGLTGVTIHYYPSNGF